MLSKILQCFQEHKYNRQCFQEYYSAFKFFGNTSTIGSAFKNIIVLSNISGTHEGWDFDSRACGRAKRRRESLMKAGTSTQEPVVEPRGEEKD